VIPNAREIQRVEEALDWLALIGDDSEQAIIDNRRIVWMQAEGYRWKQICRAVGCVRSTAWRRWTAALVTIASPARISNWRSTKPSSMQRPLLSTEIRVPDPPPAIRPRGGRELRTLVRIHAPPRRSGVSPFSASTEVGLQRGWVTPASCRRTGPGPSPDTASGAPRRCRAGGATEGREALRPPCPQVRFIHRFKPEKPAQDALDRPLT